MNHQMAPNKNSLRPLTPIAAARLALGFLGLARGARNIGRDRRCRRAGVFLTCLVSGLLLLVPAGSEAAVTVLIQPTADLANVQWTVEWDNLDGASNSLATFAWDSMDPATGGLSQVDPWGDVVQVTWFGVGDPFGAAYVNGNLRGFGHGVDGVVASGEFGVSPVYDGGPIAGEDDLYLFVTDATSPFPSSGSFTLVVPGANIGNYNPGVYTNNLNVTITVTTTPVPEPASLALLGVGGLALLGRRRSRCGLRTPTQPDSWGEMKWNAKASG